MIPEESGEFPKIPSSIDPSQARLERQKNDPSFKKMWGAICRYFNSQDVPVHDSTIRTPTKYEKIGHSGRQADTAAEKTARKLLLPGSNPDQESKDEKLLTAKERSFSQKLQIMNKHGEPSSTLGKTRGVLSNLFMFKRKWGVHVAAEHMSQQELARSLPAAALEATIEHLKQLGHSELAKKLRYTLSIERLLTVSWILFPFSLGLSIIASTLLIARKVRKDVQCLDEGNSLVIPSIIGVLTHATITEIKCTGKDPDGKKLFRITVYNTGVGREVHYKANVNERLKFQTAYIVENVSEEKLCGSKSRFFQKLFFERLGTPAVLYRLLHTLGPSIKTADHRCWEHGQIGDSCTSSCLLSFLRANMDEKQFKDFKTSVRMNVFLKIYQDFRDGSADPHMINVAMEIAKKLNKTLQSDDLKKALDEMGKSRSRAEDKTGPIEEIPESAKKEDSPVDAFFSVLKDMKKGGVYTPDHHLRLMKTLTDGLKRSRRPLDEKERVAKLLTEMASFINSSPILTKDQIYLCTAMLVWMQQKSNLLKLVIPKQFEKACVSMFIKYSQLKKDDLTKDYELDRLCRDVEIKAAPLTLFPIRAAQSHQYGQTIKDLIDSPDSSLTDLYLFLKKTSLNQGEEALSRSALKKRLQESAKKSLLREEFSLYQEEYDTYLKIASDENLLWYEAEIFANSCAMECVHGKTQFSKLEYDVLQTNDDEENEFIKKTLADFVTNYLDCYSSAYLSQLKAARSLKESEPPFSLEKVAEAAHREAETLTQQHVDKVLA